MVPYYNEQRGSVSAFAERNGVVYPIVRESSKATTYRSQPSVKSLVSNEILDVQADPYAYFLELTSEKKYRARLAERKLPSRGAPDRGHAFELCKHIVKCPGSSFSITNPRYGTTESYKDFVVFPMLSAFSTDPLKKVHEGHILTPAPYKETGLDVFAQQAYNKLAPTSVVFDSAQFLGELREGLPKFSSETLKSLIRGYNTTKREVVSGIGSDYLNAEFGWKPFVSDLQNAAKALFDATHMLSNQGKRVHRKLSLPPMTVADELFYKGAYLNFSGGSYGLLDTQGVTALGYPSRPAFAGSTIGTADMDYMKVRSSRRWFEGEFTSFFPLGFDPSNFFDRFNQLVKFNPTPSTLWQLAPWSWLVDWSLRIEDTIAANEKVANDLLVMHYGYAMETTVYKTAVSWKHNQSGLNPGLVYKDIPQQGTAYSETVYKRRLRANPYGFRTGGSQSLSEGQAAILGALGLTRLK